MQVPQFTFNAQQYQPNQGMGIHPPAQKIPFTITNTEIKETSAKDGQFMLEIEFTSPLGMIINRYNIKNNSAKTVEIAYGQLSALCHAVGRYNINGATECAELRGATGLMDIGYQKNEEPDPNHPDRKGYTELKRVYDMAGNMPGKTGTPQQAQPQTTPQGQQAAPLQQQPGGSWSQQPQTQQAPQQAPQGQQGGGQAWQPGNGGQAAANPPWGPR